MLENVQPNWNETDETKDDFIKGKPTIPAAQVQADYAQTDSSAIDFIKGKPSLAAVATTGAYSDLSGKPVLDNFATDLRKTPLCVTIADSTAMQRVRWWRVAGTSGAYSGVFPEYNIEYSTDMATWTTMTFNQENGNATETLVLGTGTGSIGNKVYFRGDNAFIYGGTRGRMVFQCLGNASDAYTAANAVDLSGNLYSIFDKTGFATRTTLPTGGSGVPAMCFGYLFANMNNSSLPYSKCNIRHAKDLQLPATTLNANCYTYLFGNNANLTSYMLSAPELPATTLAQGCYAYMFIYCSALTQAPSILPALTLVGTSPFCYMQMFRGCSSLEQAPKICATNLTDATTMASMFQNCTSLKNIDVDFPNWGTGSTPSTSGWLGGNSVGSSGTFKCPASLPMDVRDTSHVPSGWAVVYKDVDAGSWKNINLGASDYFAITPQEGSGTVTINAASGAAIEFCDYTPQAASSGYADWKAYSSGMTVYSGRTYYLRNAVTTAAAISDQTNPTFNCTCKFSVSGDITTLLKKDGYMGTPPSGAFYALFKNCTTLVDASGLKMPSLASTFCFSQMFSGCTNLSGAPVLPAPKVYENSYYQMFYNCSGLATPPALPATELAASCYYEMFKGCVNLQTAPALPATTLADNCYYGMFSGCSSLLVCPDLPATTLASSCYREMFLDCTSLIRVPATLPAATLTGSCYHSMFNGCSALQKVPYNFLTSATALAQSCYYSMFRNCSSLTEAPNLKSLPLYQNCYSYMFAFCRLLRRIPALTATELGAVATATATAYGGGTCVMMFKATFPVGYEPLNSAAQNGKYIYIVPEGTTLSGLPANVTAIVGDGNLKNRMTYDWQDVTNLVAHSDATVYGVTPNGIIGHITVDSGLTLHATSSPYLSSSTGTVDYAELIIDLAEGATVTAGANITFADTLTAGKRNICVVRFTTDGGTLYVTALEDLPASE